jgi:NAD(P)-dependent dehydrogenase (short-subunit alcohol dehydrogenase family)
LTSYSRIRSEVDCSVKDRYEELEVASTGYAPLEGKTALITGGTTGIGFATAERLISDGVRSLVITGQNTARLQEAAGRLGHRAVPIRADVRSVADLDQLAAAARQAFGGRLDILFANAGIGSFAPIEQVNQSFYDDQFDVNVKGLFFAVQKLLPLMGEGGSIILNASAVNAKGVAGGHVYFATKAAVRSLARTLAAELAPRGIRVNAVSPGLVPTPFVGKMGLPQEALDRFAGIVTAQAPLARLGKPEEIASAVAFLAGSGAAYITAADLAVDGGWMNV